MMKVGKYLMLTSLWTLFLMNVAENYILNQSAGQTLYVSENSHLIPIYGSGKVVFWMAAQLMSVTISTQFRTLTLQPIPICQTRFIDNKL